MAWWPCRRLSGLAGWLVLAAGLLLGLGPARAADGEMADKVKAAYLYNFTKFIDWQKDGSQAPDEPIRICVLGDEHVAVQLAEVESRVVQGRPLEVRLVMEAHGLEDCDVLFISHLAQERLAEALARVRGGRVLTVSDIPRFSRRGGVIGFVNEDDRVKIEISASAVRQAGLKVGASLMEVAKIVP